MVTRHRTRSRRVSAARLLVLAVACAAALPVFLTGCAGMAAGRLSPSVVDYAPAESARDAAPRAAPRAATKGAPAPAKPGASGGAAAEKQEAAPQEPAAQPQSRLRVYSGYLELVVAEVDKARQRVVDAAGQMGGYVEQTTSDSVVVRVPAARFDEAMEGFSGLGEVKARSVEAADVTDAYADLGRRIDIDKRTRQRLYDLLDKTTDVTERVGILREIRRLTEEIEQLSAALTTIAGQIALSRITVRLIPRMDEAAQGGARIPFPWIAGLSPLYPHGGTAGAAIELVVPAEYAVFEKGARIRLEAADGTRLSVGAVTNEPRGDTAFWRDALAFHLRDLYRSSEPTAAGRFEGVVLESKDPQPFSYLVAVAVRGEEILLAEAFFPDAKARVSRLPGILAMLEGVKP
jgi:hypothetical protein